MNKKIDALCDTCESTFELIFDANLVEEYQDLICPFCGDTIESVSEDDIHIDIFNDEDYLDD